MITTPELPLLVFGVLLTDQLYYYYDPYSLLSYKLYKGLGICFFSTTPHVPSTMRHNHSEHPNSQGEYSNSKHPVKGRLSNISHKAANLVLCIYTEDVIRVK